MTIVQIEMDGRDRIMARFADYDPKLVSIAKGIPGGRFVGPNKGGPGWRFHLDMQTCAALRKAFGEDARFSDEILEWGRVQKEEKLRAEAIREMGDADYDFSFLKGYAPEMFPRLRNYQRVGVQFIAEGRNVLIADEPGLGKTWETIAGIVGQGEELVNGCHLVICPKISIESVWLKELNLWVQEPVFVAPEGARQRRKLLEEVSLCREEEIPFWLVVNPQMITLRRNRAGRGVEDLETGDFLERQFPFLFEIEWDSIILDEAHESGIANPSSQFSKAMRQIHGVKRVALTGTPMGGKPLRLWGILHWLEPREFSSKHRWAETWIKKIEFQNRDGRLITKYEDLKKTSELQFYEAHARYILRRKKEEVFSELPPKQYSEMWVEMEKKQADQYRLMEQESIANLMELEERKGQITATNVLSVNSWLKQFANGYCEMVEKGEVYNEELDEIVMKYRAQATADSPKLKALLELLSQIGADDKSTGEQVVIFTQFKGWADLITETLRAKGIPTAKITGDVSKRAERNQIQEDFQSGGVYQVIVMTTKAGGVSINLDMANSVVFFDETWNPDEQDQASDRVHRASRIHRVTVYTLRTKGTIEQEVKNKITNKKNINDVLLDRYRMMKEEQEHGDESVRTDK